MSDQQSNIGAPEEIRQLQTLIGEWDVQFKSRGAPDEPFVLHAISSSIVPLLNGAFLQEHLSIPVSGAKHVELIGLLGFDRYRKTYRFAWLDDTYAVFDVHEGNWDGEALVVNNLRSATTFRNGDQEYFSRMIWRDITANGFQIVSDLSMDGGTSWFTQAQGRYLRRR